MTALEADRVPDWETLPEDVVCPLCEYNLRGLTEPRCPECGHQFHWQELIAAKKAEHPYLFEAKRKGFLQSIFRTFRGSLWPTSFWQTLRPTQPIHFAKLMLYHSLILVITGALFIVQEAVQDHLYVLKGTRYFPSASIPGWWDSLIAVLSGNRMWLRDRTRWELLILAAGWPWLTGFVFLIFRRSLKQSSIKSDHVFRLTIYCADVILFLPPLYFLACEIFRDSSISDVFWNWDEVVGIPISVTGAILLAWLAYRLLVGYRVYLGFRHALITVLLSQIVVGLIFLQLNVWAN